MASEKVLSKLNDQVAEECAASQTYLAMASWCEQNALGGAASFFYAHSDEEREHMVKIMRFMNSSGGGAAVGPTEPPTTEFTSLKSALEQALENEKKVTASINDLTTLALSEKDYDSFNLLQWFVEEQREEEQLFQGLLDKFDRLGEDGRAVHSIDKLMGRMAAAE